MQKDQENCRRVVERDLKNTYNDQLPRCLSTTSKKSLSMI